MKNWLQRLFGRKDEPVVPPDQSSCALLEARTLPIGEIGEPKWNPGHNGDLLQVSNQACTIEWPPRQWEQGKAPPAWVPASTLLRLHSGHFAWDFVVDEMADRQLGVGFMLLWDVGPDWGFFGYLGASPTAWAYDPSTGDVVSATESIQGHLPTFRDRHTGVISVELKLPRDSAGEGCFLVAGTRTQPIPLPKGAVVLPAACFLKETQKITLANFRRL